MFQAKVTENKIKAAKKETKRTSILQTSVELKARVVELDVGESNGLLFST